MWVTAVMGETRHSSRWQESSGSRLLQLSDLDLVVSDGRILRTANDLQVQMLFEFPLGGRVVKKKKKKTCYISEEIATDFKKTHRNFFQSTSSEAVS